MATMTRSTTTVCPAALAVASGGVTAVPAVDVELEVERPRACDLVPGFHSSPLDRGIEVGVGRGVASSRTMMNGTTTWIARGPDGSGRTGGVFQATLTAANGPSGLDTAPPPLVYSPRRR